MRLVFSLFILLFMSVEVCGCLPKEQPHPPQLLSDDGWRLQAVDAGLVLSRTSSAQPQLRFDLDAFQLGTVRAPLDPVASYDPWWLVVNDGVFTPVLPQGLRFRSPTSVEVTSEGSSLVLSLVYPADLHATVTARVADDGHAVLHFAPIEADAGIAFLRVRTHVDEHEAFYGLGEWFDSPNHRGALRPMQLEADLTTESGYSENHVVTPFLVGSRGWGLFVETNRYGLFDVAHTDPGVVESTWGTAEASVEGLTVHLFSADDALDIPAQYFKVSGAPAAPPPWALGPWLWRDESADQAEVLDDVRAIRTLDLATSGVWLDRPYASDVNTFDYKPAQFPDAGAMVEAIHAAGLQLALWHTPYLASTAQPQRALADELGYFPPSKGAQLNKWSAPVDFTNPAARSFWSEQLKRYTQHGVAGFKLDFAEDVIAGLGGHQSGWRFFDGSTERTMHADYTRLYHQVYREQFGSEGAFMLVRAGRWGSQKNGVVVWPGDIDATLTRYGEVFEYDGKMVVGVGGLPSAIRAGVGLSMSGFHFAADTGGYRHSPPNKETWVRWVEQSALMPVMQTGDSSSQPPWVFTAENGRDDEALSVYREFARLHLRLFPYFYSHLKRLAEGGRPVVRPFGLAFAPLQAFPDDVYVLGDELLVAPVEHANETTKRFPCPPGAWQSWWTGASLVCTAGAEVQVPAALTELPLFIRAGALVPMLRPTIDTLAPSTDAQVDSFANEPGALFVRVAPSETPSVFELFDGSSVAQRQSAEGVTLSARSGSTFHTTVVWQLAGAWNDASHGGVALERIGSAEAWAVAVQGVFRQNEFTFVKTPLDGLETVVK